MNIDGIIEEAYEISNQFNHEYMTVEHLVLALIKDNEIKKILKECNVEIKQLEADLVTYLNDEQYNNLKSDGGAVGKPRKTMAVERIFQRAFAQSIFNGRDKISAIDLLVSITNEENSHGAYFLSVNGCHRENLLDVLGEVTDGELVEEEHDYIKNLNEEALNGGIDPLIGRQEEVTDVVEILARRKKNNVCLVGEPGVGKTAIAEGMAWKIINKQVPKTLEDKTVFQIDVGTMLAGTKFRGDFEERLKGVLDQISKNENAILFIDEIHMIMGAGSAGSSQVDAANMLKPMLGKGKLLCIGATTPDEFASTFEKDRALMRRFARLDVEETTLKDTIAICKGLQSHYEEFHKVKYEEGTIEKACELADRYVKNKYFPDKALDIVDAAGAVAKVLGKKVVKLDGVVLQVSKLAKIKEEVVDIKDTKGFRNLDKKIKKKVFGQDEAVDKLVESILVSKAGLREPNKPIGTFLFVGPTGVGKTETARALADELDIKLVKFDMSEYMERHSVSKLIGAPPGYVGHAEGELGQGMLLSEIDKNPNCVLLLDEVEKAAPEVLQVLLQVMDDGRLTGATGKTVDFSNVTLIMTSNLGAAKAETSKIGFGETSHTDTDIKAVKSFFTPEFRNRIDSYVKFNKLGMKEVNLIIDKIVKETNELLASNDSKISIELTKAAKKYIADNGFEPSMGARPLKRLFEDVVKKPISKKILFDKIEEGTVLVDYIEQFEFTVK